MKLSCLALLPVAALGLAACEPTPEQNTAHAERAAKELTEEASAGSDVQALGELVAANGWARETAEGASVGGGFVTIVNGTHDGDTLLGASADFASDVQVHRTSKVNDIMTMEQIHEGLPIPAGATLKLRPGGLHLMFMGLSEPLTAGETRFVTLKFRRSGEKRVPLVVRAMTDDGAGGEDHAAMTEHTGHD